MPNGFFRWLRESFLWCAFLTFLIFAIYGNVVAWVGVAALIVWFLTGGVRSAYSAMKPEHRNILDKFGLFFQLVGLALTQKNVGYLLDAERERRSMEYDADKLDPNEPITVLSFNVHWGTLITIVCSLITVGMLIFVF